MFAFRMHFVSWHHFIRFLGCASSVVDLVFVLDSSGSIRDNNPDDGSYDNWLLLLQFVANVIDRLSISSTNTRVGVVVFSDIGDNVFYLNTFNDKSSVKNAVLNIGYVGSNTHTAAGIRAMHYEQFISQNGDRSNVENIAVIVTDGVSTTNNHTTVPEAVSARNDGIRIFSVGITANVNEVELRKMSSSPQIEGQNYWRSSDFTMLNEIIDKLVSETCGTPAPITPAPVTAPPASAIPGKAH